MPGTDHRAPEGLESTSADTRSGGQEGEAGEQEAEEQEGKERPGLRIETVAFESHGDRCEADLYLPTVGEAPWPVVVMGHVFGAERTWGLAPVAERFARAGMAGLAFDYRHLGGSDGQPRRLIDPERQLQDWRAALEYVESLEAVEGDRIALWGTSFSGGHVLEVARRADGAAEAQRATIRAVVSQVPFVDGRATVAHQTRDRGVRSRIGMLGRAVADRVGAVFGLDPIEVPVVSEPGDGGLVDSPGAMAGFGALVPDGVDLVNRSPARIVLDLPFYRPGRRAEEIDVPVHVVVAAEDRLLPAGPTEAMLERMPDASVHRVSAGHFDVLRAPWIDPVVDRQVAVLSAALGVDG